MPSDSEPRTEAGQSAVTAWHLPPRIAAAIETEAFAAGRAAALEEDRSGLAVWAHIIERHRQHTVWSVPPERCLECRPLTDLYTALAAHPVEAEERSDE